MTDKKKIISIFGTRPEAIKMAPLIKELEAHPLFESIVIVTAQHREMLDQVLELFEIIPDYDLNIMKQNQTLYDVTTEVLRKLEAVLEEVQPDMILVHGDTTTTFTAALAAYYKQIPVAHIEAGLRSGDLYSPFPEEANRKLTGVLTTLHYAPTIQAMENLINEGVSKEKIFVTGNTVIDALLHTIKKPDDCIHEKIKKRTCELLDISGRIILVTAHRRENHDQFPQIFKAISDIHDEFKDVRIIFPIHKNPKVRKAAEQFLVNKERINLIEPLEYYEFCDIMNKAYIVITDSGGIQEEAPALGKPVLVLRDNTERPEALQTGTVKLIGTERKRVYDNIKHILTDQKSYDQMAFAINPYGDGNASKRIVDHLKYYFGHNDTVPLSWDYSGSEE